MPEFWRSASLPQLEARRSCRQVTCYRPHAHDRLSIGLIDSGTSVLTGASDRSVGLRPRDVIVIPAGHVHACNPDNGRWEYQMIHADQNWLASLLPQAATTLLECITVLRDEHLHRRLSAVTELVLSDAARPQIEEALRNALSECAAVQPWCRIGAETDAELSWRLAPVLQRLHEDASTPSLDDLAALAGMSRYQLIRSMKRATGLSPVAWRHNDRVNTARALLRQGRPVAEVAHALGFADQSHFHRVFRAYVATTPGTYRA